MKLIIAKNKKDYIGLNGGLPWKSSEDLKHFKKMTMGCKLLVGRTTYESMPKLPGRELIVVGKGYYTLEEALKLKPDWVIGGKMLYESTIELCNEMHVSEIDDKTIGDTLVPDLSKFKGDVHIYKYKTN